MKKMLDFNALRSVFRTNSKAKDDARALRKISRSLNTSELYLHDSSAGSEISAFELDHNKTELISKTIAIAELFRELKPKSLLHANAGEGTVLAELLDAVPPLPFGVMAFDISLSRLLYAKRFLENNQRQRVTLFTADPENIPVATGSCDIVFQGWQYNPIRALELKLLSEMLRVSRRYLVLAPALSRNDLDAHRSKVANDLYFNELCDILSYIDVKTMRIEQWRSRTFVDHDTPLIVIERAPHKGLGSVERPKLKSPIGSSDLKDCGSYLLSRQYGYVFPIIEGIPCLLSENGIKSEFWA